MGSFIGSVVLHTTDSEQGAAFWREARGYVSREENAEFLVPPEWTPPSRTRHDLGDGMHVHLDRGDGTARCRKNGERGYTYDCTVLIVSASSAPLSSR